VRTGELDLRSPKRQKIVFGSAQSLIKKVVSPEPFGIAPELGGFIRNGRGGIAAEIDPIRTDGMRSRSFAEQAHDDNAIW
jgi:hypothetical protein